MPGFSITLLLLPSPNDTSAPSAEILLSLLDKETDAPGWKWCSHTVPPIGFISPCSVPIIPKTKLTTKLKFTDPQQFTESIERACKALIDAEAEITRFDNIAGDADCGLTLKVRADL